jgi:hypothetical protein
MAENGPATVSLYRQPDQGSLALDSSFNFHCHAGLACFNRCCRTPTILLSPYDLLRLRQSLGITAAALLKRYTRRETEASSNLPLVFLDSFNSPGGGCPFAGPQGCTVYAHRPAACRLFPITMGSGLTEQGLVDHYFCRRLDYCRGFDTEVQWTLVSWMANQGFAEYDAGRREWLEILLAKGLRGIIPVEPEFQDLFAALYDPAGLRRLLSEPAFLQACDFAGQAAPSAGLSDLALLNLGYRCLKSLLP